MNYLKIIGRKSPLFLEDLIIYNNKINDLVEDANFLVLGGGGSIGQAVTKELFKRKPRKLHVVDINENNLVELVRDIRSSFGYIDGDFKTFTLDIGSIEYDAFFNSDGNYDYVLNLSALKHVRSEKDPYTLMRMIDVNILNTIKTLKQASESNVKKYFCVSTDKATNPVNMMGASKSIMEMCLIRHSMNIDVSSARFANVVFSDGSLLYSFEQRLQKMQPIVAPNDVRRYFITPQEAGELCLMSCVIGENREVFFPKLFQDHHLMKFTDVAVMFLKEKGFDPYLCYNEDEARDLVKSLPKIKKWPCLFLKTDTTGEKDFEEFWNIFEKPNLTRFHNLGVIKSNPVFNVNNLDNFIIKITELKNNLKWNKEDLIKLFCEIVPEFKHKETGKYLDSKM